ncbi:MAG: DUF2634 domain-containing protein [Oscillospiraceae bacterium]
MFPIYKEEKTNLQENINVKRGKTFLFDFDKGDFVINDGKLQAVNGENGLKVWIQKCLHTSFNKYDIYKATAEPYGINDSDLTDRLQPLDFLYAEIEREVKEALLQNKEIVNVSGFVFERLNKVLIVNFKCSTNYGELEVFKKWS